MVYVLKELAEGDGVNCAVKLFTREDTAVEAFKAAVFKDVEDHNWSNTPGESTRIAKEILKQVEDSGEGEFEGDGNRKIYYDLIHRSYEYCDYNDNYNTNIRLQDLPIID